MGSVYLPGMNECFFMVNVGKYTIHLMDPMGIYGLINGLHCFFLQKLYIEFFGPLLIAGDVGI